MTELSKLAAFVEKASYEVLSDDARLQLRIRVLDALGCAIGALGAEPIEMIYKHIDEMGGNPLVTIFGGGKTAPDLATLYNSALVRYLDYNDSYLAPGETCHPSDNVAAVLAACEYAGGSGKEFMTALAVAYQVQCRLSDVAPVRAKGFDHTTQGAYAVAAATAKSLGLDRAGISNAIAISGTANNALRVTRTGRLSHWKGLAYPYTAFNGINAAFLARQGITGPEEVFEGNKGFMDAIAGRFAIDWKNENLEAVRKTIIKKYDAEIHSQSALEGILELKRQHNLSSDDIERIELDTFDVAYNIIGGGEEGDKKQIRTKEEADHSLPYLLAVALIDGCVGPSQYVAERITRQDVQELLRKVLVRTDPQLSSRFPQEMPARIKIVLKDTRTFSIERNDYDGFLTLPMSWNQAMAKFSALASRQTRARLVQEIVDAVAHLESIPVRTLTGLLSQLENRQQQSVEKQITTT